MYDGLYTFAVRILKIVLTAGLGILTARMLGPAGRGIYALPGVEAALVASAYGGLTSATSYFLLNRKPGASFLRPVLACSALLVAAGMVAIVALTLVSGQRDAALPAIVVLPSLALISIASGYAVGVKQVRYSTTLAALQTIFTILAMLVGFFVIAKTPGIAITAWICGTSATGAIALAYIVLHARRHLQGTDTIGFREYWRFSLKVCVVNVVSLLNYRADLYIVALFLTPAALGMYSIAVAGAESLLVPTQVSALVTSPHIGSLDVRTAAALTARCVRHNLLVAVAVCGLLYVFAGPIVQLLYGQSFMPLVPAFDVLLVGVFALSLSSPLSSYFTLKLGRPQVALVLASLSAVVCIATTLVLLPSLGMVGAAIGSTAGYVAGQGTALWYFARSASIGFREMLVPRTGDLAVYTSFVSQVLRDGRRLLRPVH
jgi:O-antigen/teichoic acid export membrane protein